MLQPGLLLVCIESFNLIPLKVCGNEYAAIMVVYWCHAPTSSGWCIRGVGLIVWISSSLGVHRLFPLFGRRLIWPGWFKLGRKMPWHCSAHPQFNFQWDSVGWWRSPWSVYKRLTSRLPGGVRMWKREGRWLLPFFSFFCLLSPVFFFSPAWNKKKTGTAKQQAAGRLCEWSQCKRQGKVYFKITWHFEANINGSLLINVCLMRKRAP